MAYVNLDRLFDGVLDVEEQWHGDDRDVDEIVELWLQVTHAQRMLADLAKVIADDATSRLLDRDDPRADYETAHGDVVHLARGYGAERWRGREVCRQLAEPLVDRFTGDIVPAVPLDVLTDVLPGVADDDATSSRWRTTGLRRHLEDWQRYRSRDDAPLVIKRGPRPTKP